MTGKRQIQSIGSPATGGLPEAGPRFGDPKSDPHRCLDYAACCPRSFLAHSGHGALLAATSVVGTSSAEECPKDAL